MMYVVYDGDCGFCHWFIDRFLSDRDGDIPILAHQLNRYPTVSALLVRHNVPDELCARTIVAVNAERAICGHSVINRILQRRGGVWRVVVGLVRLPGMHAVERACYAVVARQRRRISRLLGLRACKL